MGVGGMSSLPDWNEWGVRDRGSVPLVVPHSSLVILTVNVLLSVSDLLC